MANSIRKGKESSRKKTAKKKGASKPSDLERVESEIEEIALTDFAENTREQLHTLGEKINEATDRGVHLVKDIADEVHKFAKDATELTKAKIELHNLKEEKEKLYTLMGEQLRNLYKAQKLTKIKTRFKDDFIKLDNLEAAIKEKEKEIEGFSLLK